MRTPVKNCIPKLLAALTLGLSLSVSPAWAAKEVFQADRIVAIVGSEPITLKELQMRLQTAKVQLKKQGTPLPPEDVLQKQMLERMIIDRVQVQMAKETGLWVEDAQLNQTISRIAAGNKLSLDQFQLALKKDGLDFDQFREEIRSEMMISRLREREVDSRITVTEPEIDLWLANQEQTVTQATEYAVAHILLRIPEDATPSQTAQIKARAEQALARARKGENFSQLVASYSDAPDALQGGLLGWRPLNGLPTLFAEVVPHLKPGEPSQILRSPNGFHIVLVLNKRGGEAVRFEPVQQTRARHILVRMDQLVSEADARHKLESVRQRLLNGEDFVELARLYSQDGSASKGGDLGWLYQGDTVPDFEHAMDVLRLGEISPVVRSPFGLHIIQVMDRRIQEVSDERRRVAAKKILRERKADESYQDWLRQMRDRAYVEMRLDDE